MATAFMATICDNSQLSRAWGRLISMDCSTKKTCPKNDTGSAPLKALALKYGCAFSTALPRGSCEAADQSVTRRSRESAGIPSFSWFHLFSITSSFLLDCGVPAVLGKCSCACSWPYLCVGQVELRLGGGGLTFFSSRGYPLPTCLPC